MLLPVAIGTAQASQPEFDRTSAYVQARAAEIEGDEARSARIYVQIATADPSNADFANRAISTAIGAGEADLALGLAKSRDVASLNFDGRLLLAADALKRGKSGEALAVLDRGDTKIESMMLAPFVRAWAETVAGSDKGIKAMADLSADNALAGISRFHRTAMLIRLDRADEAMALIQERLGTDGEAAARQRIALAAALSAKGKSKDAQELLKGDTSSLARARAVLSAGKPLSGAIDTPAKAYTDLLMSLSADLGRAGDKRVSANLAQIASFTQPDNGAARVLLAVLLDQGGRSEDALALLASVPSSDPMAANALDVQTRILSRDERYDEVLAKLAPVANARTATIEEIGRYADVLGDMGRHKEAAALYGRAISQAEQGEAPSNLWTLHLLRAASLEEADQWSAAKADLNAALALEPENPILLNFLGYGKLERGEDLDAAEAMIRKASALRPDDASITDSLGWALYKRGNLPEAIELLRRAAEGDPAQAEIHEHLGDALFASGNRIEARFSWRAALLTSEGKASARLQAKIDDGLNKTNAAP